MKMEHNSLAARRKFMGDFSLSTSANLLSSEPSNVGGGMECIRHHHRPTALFPAHILPHLYLGNDETAKNLKVLNRCGIRHVINVTSNLPNYFEDEPGFQYLRIPVDDSSSHNLFQFFPEAISFIEKAHADNCSVLVHCWAGLSRSVTVCLAYLMYVMNSPLEHAFDLLLKLNGAIAPNFHFLETLTCWERLLLSGSSAAAPSTSSFSSISDGSSSMPSSSTVSIASSEVSPIAKEFSLSEMEESIGSPCCHHRNLHIPCHKTASSPTISMNLPSSLPFFKSQTPEIPSQSLERRNETECKEYRDKMKDNEVSD